MSRLALFFLGPPRLELDGEPVHIARRKAVALLAYLAVAGGSHSRDSLATLLWPEYDQSRARAALRRTLSELNRTLGSEWLTADRETAGLNPGAGLWLDVDQFHSLLSAWQGHGHPEADICPECLDALAGAVELYQGDFLAGFTLRDSANFDEFQFFQTEGLKDHLAGALVRLASYHTSQGEYEPAIGYARRWLALDPLHEPAHRHLMALYAHAGQQSAALRQYQLCEQTLLEELGLPPSEETKALYEQIRTQPPDRAEPVTPIPRTRHNLPFQPTPFVGREALLAEIKDRLEDPACRLLTLVGPGGSGKTRLALEAAADILSEAQPDNYPHGVYFVSLAPLESAEAIVPTVAQALGFSFYGGGMPQQQLLDYLRHKRMLIVMDNFEHLLDGVGLVSDVLKTGSDVKILATSRAGLNAEGEHRFHVAGMDFPEPTPPAPAEVPRDTVDYSAIKLFVQSAQRARHGFELQADDLEDVVRICRLVEGMPLGILLAAAWVELLSPQEIVSEIGRSLDFLETDVRGVPERQRSMRAVFDHSWKLLTEREREVFQGMSVFRGGFTRQAAEQVTGASLRELMALVDKSLFDRAPTDRYEVHELLRQYAAEKLDQSSAAHEAARDRHCAYYAAALQRWGGDLKGPRQQAALSEIEADIENARTAWDWAVEQGRVVRLNQALEGLCRFYEWRGRCQEGEVACRTAAGKVATAASGDGRRVLAKILRWQGAFDRLLGRTELAGQLLRQSLALLGQLDMDDEGARLARAYTLLEMGHIAAVSHGEEARKLCKQSLALFQAVGDRWGTAQVLHALGEVVAWHFGAWGEAKRLYEESLAIRHGLGDQRGIADSLEGLSNTAIAQGQLEEGERLARQSIAIHRKIGDRTGIADGYSRLGQALWNHGEYADAHTALEESIALYDDLGVREGLAIAHGNLGWVKGHLGQYEEARGHLQMGLVLSRESGYRFGTGWCLGLLGAGALAEGAYVEAQQLLKESLSVYQEMGQREGVGWVLTGLGSAALGLGNVSQARQHFHEALQIATELGSFITSLLGTGGIALLLAVQGEKERAVELYALASRYGFVANSRFLEDVAGQHVAAVAATLPPDVVAAAQERGKARDLDATVAELLVELGE